MSEFEYQTYPKYEQKPLIEKQQVSQNLYIGYLGLTKMLFLRFTFVIDPKDRVQDKPYFVALPIEELKYVIEREQL